jgi:hypothetical protein
VSFDSNGNLVVVFSGAISGSGIRTSTSDPQAAAGDVYFFAPRGTVNAGEAGIGGTNIIIAANAVIGAGNIQATGTSIGVPTTPPAITIPAGASNAATSATQQAGQQIAQQSAAQNAAAAANAATQQLALNPLQVDLVGFGECSVSDIRDGKPGCGG